jgi:hypothetical protein
MPGMTALQYPDGRIDAITFSPQHGDYLGHWHWRGSSAGATALRRDRHRHVIDAPGTSIWPWPMLAPASIPRMAFVSIMPARWRSLTFSWSDAITLLLVFMPPRSIVVEI